MAPILSASSSILSGSILLLRHHDFEDATASFAVRIFLALFIDKLIRHILLGSLPAHSKIVQVGLLALICCIQHAENTVLVESWTYGCSVHLLDLPNGWSAVGVGWGMFPHTNGLRGPPFHIFGG